MPRGKRLASVLSGTGSSDIVLSTTAILPESAGQDAPRKPAPVTTYFEPDAFTWYERQVRGPVTIKVKAGEIRIPSALGVHFLAAAQADESGHYHAAIGFAPKALAIRPLPPDRVGFLVRKERRSSGIIISCTSLLKQYGLGDHQLEAQWDARSQMLVAMLPRAGDADGHAP